jgi:RNA polymerase sigma-70 factor (ECF subfamily)
MKIRSMTWGNAIPRTGTDDAAETTGPLMDDEAFAGFHERTARPLWAYLARVSGNATAADDLLQESYLRFLGAVRWQDGEVACRRYLFRIATNLLHDHWRRPVPASLDEVSDAALATDGRCDSQRMESQALLGPALARMSPRERQLLWLAYAEGATHKEIADITGLSTPSIRILLFRARRKMARLLRPEATA